MKFENRACKEGKGGSLKKEDKINSRTKADVKDVVNPITAIRASKAKTKALAQAKK